MRRSSAADDQLIRHARTHGLKVTPRQLERWRQEGILDRPTRIHLGRGKGTTSVASARSLKQVVRIAQALEDGATFEEIR